MMTVTRFDQICQAWVAHFPTLEGYVRVVTESQATAKLSDRRGIQLVAVLPSYGRGGNAVTPRRTQTALFWIVPAKVGGTWKMPQGELTLTQKFQMITGTLGTTQVTGRLRGAEITFTGGGNTYTGRVNGNTIQGNASSGGAFTATKVR